MRRDTKIQMLAAGALAVCLAGSGALAVLLTASIGRNRLAYTDKAEEGEPPQVALGIAMGAFRGLFVNMLWMRANTMKEAGKFHEAMDLARAITTLQPRFPRVWAFHAWNMAYNISVTTQTREERWKWVDSGVRLLRDEGIPANPNDLVLHRELAWIYLHKIQGYTDDANNYYKQQVAKEWTVVMGPPPPPDPSARTREGATKLYVDWLTKIAEAPAELAEVERLNPAVTDLVKQLRTRVEEDPEGDADAIRNILKRYELHRALRNSARRPEVVKGFGPKSAAMEELVSDPSRAEAWTDLTNHLRRVLLTRDYHMEPHRMIRYTEEFGPLDWRHPASHGLYWSARGLDMADARWREENRKDYDFTNAGRVAIQAVQELARSGELYYGFLESAVGLPAFYLATPSTHFFESYGERIDKMSGKSFFEDRSRPYTMYGAGFENFIADGIRFLYRRGERARAEQMLRMIGTWPWQNINDPTGRIDRFSKTLDEFVAEELKDRASSPYVAVGEVTGALQGAYVSGLLAGDAELFRAQFKYAADFHSYYMNQQLKATIVDPDQPRMELMPADFADMAGQVYSQFIATLTLEDAERVYSGAPDALKRYAFDMFKQALADERRTEALGGRKFEDVFPEPPGMEQFRAEQARKAPDRPRPEAK